MPEIRKPASATAEPSPTSSPGAHTLDALERDIAHLQTLSLAGLREAWREKLKSEPPPVRARGFLLRLLAWNLQADCYGGLTADTRRKLKRLAAELAKNPDRALRGRASLPTGATLVREWKGVRHAVEVIDDGYLWEGQKYRTLTKIARAITKTRWSGPRFFGVEEELVPTIKARRA